MENQANKPSLINSIMNLLSKGNPPTGYDKDLRRGLDRLSIRQLTTLFEGVEDLANYAWS